MAGEAPQTFSAYLRQLREAAGLTQEQLAERAHLSVQAIGALERGDRRYPYPHTVQALADALELPQEARASLSRAASRRSPSALPGVLQARASIPRPPTPIIGRDHELEEIGNLLQRQQVRLLTLTGPGGVGKTRIALEVAASVGEVFPDGVVFVALAAVSRTDLVLPTLAQALGLQQATADPLLEAVRRYLYNRRLLLVLDNFEQIVDAAVEIAELLVSCESLFVLTTSRAPLHIRGEHLYMVHTLWLPDVSHLPTPEEVMRASAVRLFVERARAVSPNFELTRTNAVATAAICRRLAGLPLAIELAAARVRSLSPTALLARLDRVLPLLGNGAQDLPERQRTMRRTIEWSYDLLAPDAQTLFRRLAVFAGGWTIEAAEEIVSIGADELEVVDVLGRLVDQSMVVTDTHGDTMRYRLLEPLREYALELLHVSGEAHDVHRRHADLYLKVAERLLPQLRAGQDVDCLEQLESEHDNLRAAMEWLLQQHAVEDAGRLGWALWRFWWARGYHDEGRRWMEQIAEHLETVSVLGQAQVQYVLATMLYRLGDYTRPARLFHESIRLFQQAGDVAGTGLALTGAGVSAVRAGDLDGGMALLEASLACLRQEQNLWDAALVLTYLGVIPFNRGDYPRAMERFEEGLALARAIGSGQATYIALYDVALAAHAQAEYTRATSLYREGLLLCTELGDTLYGAYFLEGLAGVAGGEGAPQRAARLFAASRAVLERLGVQLHARATDPAFLKRSFDQARAQQDDQAWADAWAEGQAMSLEQAIAYALEDVALPLRGNAT